MTENDRDNQVADQRRTVQVEDNARQMGELKHAQEGDKRNQNLQMLERIEQR
jgi:hypothetical protein